MAQRDWGVEPTPEQRAWAEAEAARLKLLAAKAARVDKRANIGHPAPRLIHACHRARGRAAARDRRIRDEDLALAGRPRLHAGNCQPTMQDEWGWW